MKIKMIHTIINTTINNNKLKSTNMFLRCAMLSFLSHAQLFATSRTAARLLCSWGFSGQEYWSGLPYPSPGESFQPRDQIQVSHIAGGFFTS